MAIASFRKKKKPKIVEKVREDSYDVAIKDTRRDIPVINVISGKKWPVNYYNQYRSRDVIGSQTLNGPSFITQFSKIKVNAGFIPVKGDYIHTRAADREALFKVTSVTKQYYDGSDIYFIEFVIDSFLDQDNSGFKLLESRVTDILYYDDNYVFSGGKPLLREEDRNKKFDLKNAVLQLVNRYNTKFLKNDLLKLGEIVDKNLIDFYISIVDTSLDPRINDVELVGDPTIADDTIFNFIINRKIDGLSRTKKYIHYKDVSRAKTNIGIYAFLGVKTIVDVDYVLDDTLTFGTVTYDVNRKIPNVPTEDGYYIFTSDFYNGDSDILIEKVLLGYLRSQEMNEEELQELINLQTKWTDKELYYLAPFLIFLISAFLRGE